jgi:outer membrane protein W
MEATMKRLLIVVFAVAVPLQLFAQAGTYEIGGAFAMPMFESDEIEEEDITIEIDGSSSWGATVNRYWTNRFSTELSLYRLSGAVDVSDDVEMLQSGGMDLKVIGATGQWHFRPAARLDPYLGLGVARITGSFDDALDGADQDSFDVEAEYVGVANVGIGFLLTEHLAVAADAKYLPYEPREEGGGDDDRVTIDPLIVSVNVRFRF